MDRTSTNKKQLPCHKVSFTIFIYMYYTFTALMKAFGFDSKYAETNVKIPSFIINFCSRQIPFPSLPSNNKIIRKACRHAAALLSPQTLSV